MSANFSKGKRSRLAYPEVCCKTLSLQEVRALPPIPSGFETERAFRLQTSVTTDNLIWTLKAEKLSRSFHKKYDNGDIREWMGSYEDAGSARSFQFLGAVVAGHVRGLATWRVEKWNSTLWLADIRVLEGWRRCGVGSTLIEELKVVAAKLSLRGISVETQINNVPAIEFYQKHAFRITGFNDHQYSNSDLEEQDVALFLCWEAQ